MKHDSRLIGGALIAALVALPARAADAPKIALVRGAVTAVADTTITVQGRAPRGGGDAPAPVTVAVNGDTVYAAGGQGAVSDVVANALVSVVPDADGAAPNATAIAVYVPAKPSDNSLVAVEAAGRTMGMRPGGGGGGAPAANRPKNISGTVTAVDGAKITIKTKDASVTVTTTGDTQIGRASCRERV